MAGRRSPLGSTQFISRNLGRRKSSNESGWTFARETGNPRTMDHVSPPNEVCRAALKYLRQRPLSVAQLRNRLLRRGFLPNVVEEALVHLETAGELCDSKLAEHLCKRAIENGRGPRWIQEALMKREFPNNVIAPCLTMARDAALPKAEAILRRRYGPVAIEDPATQPKAARFLANRGFEPETVEEALRAVFSTYC